MIRICIAPVVYEHYLTPPMCFPIGYDTRHRALQKFSRYNDVFENPKKRESDTINIPTIDLNCNSK